MNFKKALLLLSVITLTILILTLNVFASETTGSLKAYDSYGIRITDTKYIKSASVKITLSEIPYELSDLYVAVYDNGILYDLNYEAISTETASAEVAVRFPGTATQEIKAYVWDRKMSPVTGVFQNLVLENDSEIAIIDNPSDIQPVSSTNYNGKASQWNSANKYLCVYNPDTDTREKFYYLEDDVSLLVNGLEVNGVFNSDGTYTAKYISSINSRNIVASYDQGLGLAYSPNEGTVELIDIDADRRYDVIRVTSYETVILEDDPYANNTMLATSAGTINLDFYNAFDYSCKITLNGKEAQISDLKRDDILTIAMKDLYNWTIMATRKTIEGEISELDVTGSPDKWQFVIDGKTYVLANCADKTAIKLSASTQAGAEGIFYLDAFNKIALYDEKSSASLNYGFIVAAGEYASVGDIEYEVNILDKDGKINTYTLAENVRVNGASTASSASTVYAYSIATKAFYRGYNNPVWIYKTNVMGTEPAETLYTDNTLYRQVTTTDELEANYTNRIITYTKNSAGKITSINFVGSFKVTLVDRLTTYKANVMAFSGSYCVAEDVVIFNVPINYTSTKDDFGVTTIDSLVNDERYTGAMYNLNDEQCATALVVTSPEMDIETEEPEEIITAKGHGFIVAAGEYASVGDIEYEVRVLDKDGKINTYTLAENVRVNGASTASSASAVYVNDIATKAFYDGTFRYNPVWTYKNGVAVYKADGTVASEAEKVDNYANRIITYSVNSQNEIVSIDFTGSESVGFVGSASQIKYNATTYSFTDSYGVEDYTVIFNLPITDTSTKDDFVVTDISSLEHKKLYDVAFFKTNENFNAEVLVITNNEIEIEEPELTETDMGYGFIVAAGEYASVGDVEYEVRVLGKDGATNTYTLAENVRVNDASTAVSSATAYSSIASKAFYKYSGYYSTPVWTYKTVNGSPEAGLYTDSTCTTQVTTVSELVDNYANRIIIYKVNSQGKISSIDFVGSPQLEYVGGLSTYKADLMSFAGSYGVAEDVVIFSLPIKENASKDDFKVKTISSLEDDEHYTGAMYNLNDEQCATALIITSDGASISAKQNLAVVLKAATATNENDERIMKLTFLQGGEEKSLYTTEDIAVCYSFNKGDIFEYSTDDSGAIDKIANQRTIASLKNSPLAPTWNETGFAPKAQYVFGAVYSKNSSRRIITLAQYNINSVTVNNSISALGRNVIPENVPVTVIDCAKSNTATNKVFVGAFGDIQPTRWIGGYSVDEYSDYAVLLKYYKEEVIDVILYKNFANTIQR